MTIISFVVHLSNLPVECVQGEKKNKASVIKAAT